MYIIGNIIETLKSLVSGKSVQKKKRKKSVRKRKKKRNTRARKKKKATKSKKRRSAKSYFGRPKRKAKKKAKRKASKWTAKKRPKKKVKRKKTVRKRSRKKVKKPLRRKSPKTRKAASSKKKKMEEPQGTLVGDITHYFSKIKVIVLKVTHTDIRVGDKILVKGHTSHFTQTVKSLQIESVDVRKARRGSLVGLKVVKQARAGDKVYKI